MKKINVSLDEELIKRIDDYADSIYLNRSALISLACTQYLNANALTSSIVSLSESLRKIADSGEYDESVLEELKYFEKMVQLLGSR